MDINIDIALDMDMDTHTSIHIILNMNNYPEKGTQEIVTVVIEGDKIEIFIYYTLVFSLNMILCVSIQICTKWVNKRNT